MDGLRVPNCCTHANAEFVVPRGVKVGREEIKYKIWCDAYDTYWCNDKKDTSTYYSIRPQTDPSWEKAQLNM